MRDYYKTLLEQIEPIKPPRIVIKEKSKQRKINWNIKWEDVLGYAVTVVYFVQFFNPEHWWSIGRWISLFRIGFTL